MTIWLAGKRARAAALRPTPLKALLIAPPDAGADASATMSVHVPALARLVRPDASIPRARGVALFYTDAPDGSAPPVLAHLLPRLPVLYEVNVLLHVRFVPLPDVAPPDRLLARDTGVAGFFEVVARYGYAERPSHDAAFAAAVVDHVLARLAVRAAGDGALAAALGVAPGADAGAVRAAVKAAPPRALGGDHAAVADALTQMRVLEHARDQASVVYVVGRSDVRLDEGGGVSARRGMRARARRLLLGVPFACMLKFFQDDIVSSYGVPREQALQVVLPFDF